MLKVLKKAVLKLINLRGWELVSKESMPLGPKYLFDLYASKGIDCILDVGANDAHSGTVVELLAEGYRGQIISFEPQSAPFEELCRVASKTPGWQCRREALGAENSSLTMRLSKFTPSSSLLPLASKHLEVWPESEVVGEEVVPVRRLDDVVDELNLHGKNLLLKIDTQGYELPVLSGASKTLEQCSAVYVELLFAPLYENQSHYLDVMKAIEAAGLKFVGLFSPFQDPSTGYTLFADGLFLR